MEFQPTSNAASLRRKMYAMALSNPHLSLSERIRLETQMQNDINERLNELNYRRTIEKEVAEKQAKQNAEIAEQIRAEIDAKRKTKDEENRKNQRTALEVHVREKFFQNSPAASESDFQRLKAALLDEALLNGTNPMFEKTKEFMRGNGNFSRM